MHVGCGEKFPASRLESNSVGFVVSDASPLISSISPTGASAGSPDITLTITGLGVKNSGFKGGGISIVGWLTSCCTTWLDTAFISSTELKAVVPAVLLQNPVMAYVFVETGDPQGISDGVSYPKSKSVTFTVIAPAPAVSPSSPVLGPQSSQQFVAMMNGRPADATWTVQEGSAGGTITASGLYTGPDQVGTFHVVATFVADPPKSATATISVT